MKIWAEGLPPGLRMDSHGLITGTAPAGKGEYKVVIQTSNKHGRDAKVLVLKVGDTLCLTPPMGWSSWYSYSEAVGQENVLKTARLFVERGLVNHGWSYINIDDCWQGERGGRNFSIQPNKRFPDMKVMCDAIHPIRLFGRLMARDFDAAKRMVQASMKLLLIPEVFNNKIPHLNDDLQTLFLHYCRVCLLDGNCRRTGTDLQRQCLHDRSS